MDLAVLVEFLSLRLPCSHDQRVFGSELHVWTSKLDCVFEDRRASSIGIRNSHRLQRYLAMDFGVDWMVVAVQSTCISVYRVLAKGKKIRILWKAQVANANWGRKSKKEKKKKKKKKKGE